MPAGLKLALPLLRATLRWYVVLFMLIFAWMAWVLDSAGIGPGASAGAGALLVLSVALGQNLRRCRAQGLPSTLPGSTKAGLQAVGVILLCLVAILGALDGWRPDKLLAINVAAALGLGVGLALPPRHLQWAPIAGTLWIAVGSRDLALIWSGSWSPLLAASCLLIGLAVYSHTSRLAHGLRSQPQWPTAKWASQHGKARQTWRPGYLLSLWTPLVSVAMGVVLGVVLPIASLGEPVFARLDPVRQTEVIGYIVLFSGLGILMMLFELLGIGILALRKLAVLPGWSREQLFSHAERSAWRVTLRTAMVVALALMLTGTWSGEAMWGLWLQGLLVFGSFSLLGIYAALWLAFITGSGVRIAILSIALFPLYLIAGGLLLEANYEPTGGVLSSAPLALISVAGLAWWLRRQARSAWTSISFSRAS